MPVTTLDTLIGPLSIEEMDGAITRVGWTREGQATTPLLDAAVEQLQSYFAGDLSEFDLPLHVAGTAFQKAVCDAMLAIPLGQTRTYGEIAADLGVSAQAVGSACGHNPIPVIIPCHRVMGANGRLTGFSGMGGVETKVALLRHERAAGLLI